jgi:hypothetical protein
VTVTACPEQCRRRTGECRAREKRTERLDQ